QTSWVWAKNLSNATGSNGTGFAADNGSVPTDMYNLGLDYGNVSTTRRHRWLTTFTYQLPGASWKPADFGGQVPRAAGAGGAAFRNRGRADGPVPDADHGRRHRPERHERRLTRQRPSRLHEHELRQYARRPAHDQQLVRPLGVFDAGEQPRTVRDGRTRSVDR